ncbi:MAG: SDR family oxidoreductase [Clostridiales bacterium]|nr:SDR family oxidoreductase [Clostridiales bacterium]
MIREADLTGKNAVVTGGGTGLGLGIAGALIDAGARVLIAGRREEVLRKACQELGDQACYQVLDLRDAEALEDFVEACHMQLGQVDILVNNAGMQNNRRAMDFTYQDFTSMFDTNLIGPFLLTQLFAEEMLVRGKGSIIFISSAASHIGITNTAAYAASKGGISAMVRTLASEWSPKGVRVNAIAPGWIETDLVKESLRRVPERRAMVEHRCMIPRLGTPRDIGLAAAFLASDAAAYITAAEIKVDGGIGASL